MERNYETEENYLDYADVYDDLDYAYDDSDVYYEDDTYRRPTRVYIGEDMRVTMNAIDIDNLSIHQLENLLGILKHASQEAGKRLIAKRLRRMATLSRGNKRIAIERIRERDMYD